jgi:hypothetical protein
MMLSAQQHSSEPAAVGSLQLLSQQPVAMGCNMEAITGGTMRHLHSKHMM